MKKILVIVFIFSLLFSNVACNDFANDFRYGEDLIESSVVSSNASVDSSKVDSNKDSFITIPESENESQPSYRDLSVRQLREQLSCFVTTECEDSQSQMYSNRLEIQKNAGKSNVYLIKASNGLQTFETEIVLSKACQYAEYFRGFLSPDTGYLMIFSIDGGKGCYDDAKMPSCELLGVLWTTDQGLTWSVTEYDTPPAFYEYEYVSSAKFLTEQIGYFSAYAWGETTCRESFVDRTFWTLDGGKSWQPMADVYEIDIPDVKGALGVKGKYFATDLYQIKQFGSFYLLSVAILHKDAIRYDGKTTLYLQYYSADLQSWELLGSDQAIYVGSADVLSDMTGKYPTFQNFVNDEIGYCFIFDANYRLVLFLKTADGGVNWTPQGFDGEIKSSHYKNIICAKMLDESIGMISHRYIGDPEPYEIAYLTADGGVTWNAIGVSSPWYLYGAYDLLYENGRYVLLCHASDENAPTPVRYASVDLKTWELIS